LRQQLEREPMKLPQLTLSRDLRDLDDVKPLLELDTEALMKHFVLEGYEAHPAINFKVAV
jgi:thymidylate synthase